ncbi:5452_t:CDS:2 [Racocetra persica]|uniref:5452_t:CDS:1 n=1 Tax=Racocetra persica TaxID=160502 RepID=A0ACA9M1H5_9GLOM|nr:5452_t:CDS:2 [Racocetra persica]
MNSDYTSKKIKTTEKYLEEELHYYSELYLLRTTETPILLGKYSTRTQLIFTPKYGIPGGKQEYPHEIFERIAERETLEETRILIYQEKLIEIEHSYYLPKDTNGYNTTNTTEIKTYIHPSNNQEPLQIEPNNYKTWKYYTKPEILDHIIIIPELQLQLNLIFYSIENY